MHHILRQHRTIPSTEDEQPAEKPRRDDSYGVLVKAANGIKQLTRPCDEFAPHYCWHQAVSYSSKSTEFPNNTGSQSEMIEQREQTPGSPLRRCASS